MYHGWAHRSPTQLSRFSPEAGGYSKSQFAPTPSPPDASDLKEELMDRRYSANASGDGAHNDGHHQAKVSSLEHVTRFEYFTASSFLQGYQDCQ